MACWCGVVSEYVRIPVRGHLNLISCCKLEDGENFILMAVNIKGSFGHAVFADRFGISCVRFTTLIWRRNSFHFFPHQKARQPQHDPMIPKHTNNCELAPIPFPQLSTGHPRDRLSLYQGINHHFFLAQLPTYYDNLLCSTTPKYLTFFYN